NAAGTAAVGNQAGILLASTAHGVTVGGNVISGNRADGIDFTTGAGITNVVVQGNLIGLNAAGTAAVPNAAVGINLRSANNTIGGTAAGAGNVISGNLGYGIQIQGNGTTGNVVTGNYIGTDPTATFVLGNGGDGVTLTDASGNTVGGAAAG